MPSAVSAISGVHAQMASAAELSIGARVSGIVRADVRTALWQDRSLVKTYGPRGTVHLLVADELDGDELSAAVIRNTGPWAADLVMPAFGGFWPRWRQAIVPAAHRGVLSFGQNRGSRVTYTSPGPLAEIDPDAALAWLVHRYLFAYGPATPQQFARWMAAPPAWGKRLFAKLGSQLQQVRIGAFPKMPMLSPGTRACQRNRHTASVFFLISTHTRSAAIPGSWCSRARQHGRSPVGRRETFP
jgi:hypothetical protein